jgi:sugar phosphate isomerase/epimerase
MARAGFEYVECPVATLVPEDGPEAFAPVRAKLDNAPVPVLAFNLFIPPEIKIVGPDVDRERLLNYARVSLERIHSTGAHVLVFGSGPARTVPPGFPRAKAEEQFVEFARAVGDYARKFDVQVGLESITRKGGTNFINTVAEAVAIARKVDHPTIRTMADLGQMEPENEPWNHLSEYKDWIIHIHLTDTERKPPGSGSLDWGEAFDHLHTAGYDGLMSLECRWNDFDTEAREAAAFVRKAWVG